MYKKLILFSLVSITFPCSAGKRFDNFMAVLGYSRLPQVPTAPLTAVPLTPQELAGIYGGVSTENLKETSKTLVEGAKALMKDSKATEAAAEAASYGTGHGFVYGVVSAPFHAARDGAVYMKDAAVAHPIIAGGLLTAGVVGTGYYALRGQTDAEKEQEQIDKNKRLAQLRAAANVTAADMHAEEYRTCLNRHAYDNGTCEDKIQRCHSPARKLAMLKPKKAKKIETSFRTYQ